MLIPQSVAWVRHITWQNDLRAKAKVEYQVHRWGRCSFAWDDTKGLIFNPSLPAPKVMRDPTPKSGDVGENVSAAEKN